MKAYLAANPESMLARYMGGGERPIQRQPGGNPNMYNGVTSFAAGGMVAPGGGAVRPGMPMQGVEAPQLGASAPAPINETQIEAEAKRFVQANPQAVQQIQAVLSQAIQSGELTPDELNKAIQMAKMALANPASYPQIRQFAIDNGFGTEADLPPQMDKGLLFTLLVAGKALQANPSSGAQQGNAMQGQKPAGALPEYSEGGLTGDKEHLAVVHPREYVIPEDALIYHGKKHFDKLIEQAREPKDGAQ